MYIELSVEVIVSNVLCNSLFNFDMGTVIFFSLIGEVKANHVHFQPDSRYYFVKPLLNHLPLIRLQNKVIHTEKRKAQERNFWLK